MFCPKCGEQLTSHAGELFCERGQMGLSRNLENGFTECFVARARRSSRKPFGFRVGGTWFCPGCGVKMIEDAGLVSCPACQESLNEFIPPLIELHPHRTDERSSR
jgi:uncharacterized Zn finger protein (UPF0148 family)